MKKINWVYVLALFLILAGFGASVYYYPQLPDKLASHWGINGEVNGYMQKTVALFLMPAISIALLLLFIFLPKIDPLKKNYQAFKKYYDMLVFALIGFFVYIHLITVFWNAGKIFNITKALVPAFAILFYVMGILIGKAKRNWFVGIRTPWTLASDAVWGKTHKLGSKLFKITGILALFGLFLPANYFALIIGLVAFDVLVCIVYSYLQYKKQEEKGGKSEGSGN